MNRDEFDSMISKIVKVATPVVMCENGHGVWCFEGRIDSVYKLFNKPCWKCQTLNKRLLADFEEDLL